MLETPPQPSAPRDRTIGYLCVVGAAVLWSTSAFFAKAPIFDSWSLAHRGLVLAFWRALFASLVLLPWVRRVQWKPAMLPMVAAFCAMNWLYLTAMVHVEGSIAIWLQCTAPAWVFLFVLVRGTDRIVRADWTMLAWAAAGVILILVMQVNLSSRMGLLCALLSGVMYACVVLSLRHLRDCDPVWLIFLNHFATAIIFAPFTWSVGGLPQGAQWWFLFCFGALQMGLPYVLFAHSVRRIPGHDAALIGLIEPILLPVWVFLAWRFHPDYVAPHWSTLLGGALILIGLAQRYLAPVGHRRAEPVSDNTET
jgi:drug/metabolite transporter (DMT)-like permease